MNNASVATLLRVEEEKGARRGRASGVFCWRKLYRSAYGGGVRQENGGAFRSFPESTEQEERRGSLVFLAPLVRVCCRQPLFLPLPCTRPPRLTAAAAAAAAISVPCMYFFPVVGRCSKCPSEPSHCWLSLLGKGCRVETKGHPRPTPLCLRIHPRRRHKRGRRWHRLLRQALPPLLPPPLLVLVIAARRGLRRCLRLRRRKLRAAAGRRRRSGGLLRLWRHLSASSLNSSGT